MCLNLTRTQACAPAKGREADCPHCQAQIQTCEPTGRERPNFAMGVSGHRFEANWNVLDGGDHRVFELQILESWNGEMGEEQIDSFDLEWQTGPADFPE